MDEQDMVVSNGVVDGTAEVVAATEVVDEEGAGIAGLSNAAFCAFPETDEEEATVPLIAIRLGADGQVFYRIWGFPDGGQLKALLAAAAHMGGQMADEHDLLLKRLQGVVNVAVGRQ